MSADERRAYQTAVEAIEKLPSFVCERRIALEALEGMAAAKGRAEDRRRSDRQTDLQRRKLIGAKLRLEDAAEVEMMARLQGVSTYRFVVDALAAACRKAGAKYGQNQIAAAMANRGRPCVVMALPYRQNSYAIE